MAHLMPKQRVFGDSLRVHHYYQSSPDGLRVLFGGRLAGRAGTTRARDFDHLYRDLVALFPELAGVAVTHAHGPSQATAAEPHIYEPRFTAQLDT